MGSLDANLVVVIMAGGAGTRFWPLSTPEKPKQFILLFDDRSLLQKSYDRIAGLVPDNRIFALTNEVYAHLVAEQLPRLPRQNIIGEPERKDTAAAVCLGALIAAKRFGNPVIAVLTADHVIEPVGMFQRTLLSAVEGARQSQALYTFGIKPTYPATGYGYLEVGEKIFEDDDIPHFRMISFKEKPILEKAAQYLESGRYLWNSGMFVWQANAILDALKTHLPAHVRLLEPVVQKEGSPAWESELRRAFSKLDRISIDYGVMERSRDVRCVAGAFAWKDVGGWLALEAYLDCDAEKNRVRGRLHALDAKNNLVFCTAPGETLVMVGLDDVVVVREGAKTLIARKDRLEDVKKIVESMTATSPKTGSPSERSPGSHLNS
ncbi:MAG: mannose-1-phosphate guanylyltransferase [Deltaproteobacteria bacterium]|nr:mannose-1-phosphate guanylyltransferase [Deltaproteobacteria bacterium]